VDVEVANELSLDLSVISVSVFCFSSEHRVEGWSWKLEEGAGR